MCKYRKIRGANVVQPKRKPSQKISERVSSTQSRGRTGTGVTPLVFETSASTDSAIWAFGIVGKHCGAKVLKIYKYQNLILLPL